MESTSELLSFYRSAHEKNRVLRLEKGKPGGLGTYTGAYDGSHTCVKRNFPSWESWVRVAWGDSWRGVILGTVPGCGRAGGAMCAVQWCHSQGHFSQCQLEGDNM